MKGHDFSETTTNSEKMYLVREVLVDVARK